MVAWAVGVTMLTEVDNDCTEKSLNNDLQYVKSSVKCQLVYYKWVVLQMYYKQVYVVILSPAFYSLQYLCHIAV